MNYLLLVVAVLGSTMFMMVVKYAQQRRCQMMSIGAINYVVAGLFFLVVWHVFGTGGEHLPSFLVGSLVGVSYAVSYVLVAGAIKRSGMAIAGAVQRHSESDGRRRYEYYSHR